MKQFVRVFCFCLCAAACIALAVPPALADGFGDGSFLTADKGGKGKGNNGNKNNGPKGNKGNNGGNGGKGKGGPDADGVSLVVGGITIATARGYATDFGGIGYQPLPPGIRKNLAKGKPLPPGIAKKAVPAGMLSKLPVHPGYEWQVAGSDLILVAVGTSIVSDILEGVFK